MRVRARVVDHATAPTVVRPYLGQILVTAGKEYEVQAMAAFEGDVSLQIIDDLGYPAWNTAWLFDIVDPAVPADWICSTFHDDPRLILGPAFIASSQDAYASMVQLEPEQVDRFWKRVEHQRSGPRHGPSQDAQ